MSPYNILSGGIPLGIELPPGIPQVIHVTFSPAVNAVGFHVVGMSLGSTPVHVEFLIANESYEVVPVGDSDEDASTT